MVNLNKNRSLTLLQELIKNNLRNNLDYMPESFNNEQQKALELFQKRIYLEETIEECISFNKKFVWAETNPNLKLATTAEELVEVFQLRSEVYGGLNYQDEFPDTIDGLNFDDYDQNSAIFLYKNNGKITGTTRLIYDSPNMLPIEDKFSFDEMRKKYNTIGELSRLIVKNESKGLSLEFKYLMAAIHNFFIHNDIDMTFLVIVKEHYKLYTKFGGSSIIKEFDDYGKLGHGTMVLSWNPDEVSKFFKKAFLKA